MTAMQNRGFSVTLWLFLAATAVLVGGAAGYTVFSVADLPQVRNLEEYQPSIISRVYADNHKLLAEFYLENRTPVALEDVPENLVNALIATEDVRFYSHWGIDYRGIARALYRNLRARRVIEGGSTLTQQLAKVLFLTPERSYARKLKELAVALRIEQCYTKREILTFYLNQVYFGSGAYGVEAAARIYFGKPARDLNIAECAMLAALPRSPKYYSPFKSPANARSRRAYVLSRMVSTGIITSLQQAEANKTPLPVQAAVKAGGPAPYFVEYVRQKVEERFGSSILYSGGLNIYTSLNDELQGSAEEAVSTGLAKIEARLAKTGKAPLQAALFAMEPATGRIRAMVGGRDFTKSQFNRALQALRQPGSAFKPIIYAAAIEHGFSASDILDDSPLTIKIDRRKIWEPENFTRTYQGPVTLRRALGQSLNVPTIRLLEKVGIEETIGYARKLGIRSQLAPYLSLALGSSDVTLAELTSAYAVFANHGTKIGPVSILTITDRTGRVLYMNDAVPEQAMKPETAYLTTYLLKGVIEHGTGWKAQELGRPSAGKTGTTNDFRDAWFIGYTPALVAGVWVGRDNQESIGPKETGARTALPIWLEFMKKAHADRTAEDFAAPDGIVFKQIDPGTGLLSMDHCRSSIREAYIPGTEPRRYCEETAQDAEEPPIQDEVPAGETGH
ncbi:MAG TPA: PBP1A family penicillin-binding protein [Nitrospirota bacterium]|nr:PBP1A family penicillin-binding protein [Nitrospirota bacterium]